MERITTPNRSSLLSVVCAVFGHDFIITQKITDHISEYKCVCCGKEVSDSYSGKFEELTYRRKEINECLYQFFQKKRRLTLH